MLLVLVTAVKEWGISWASEMNLSASVHFEKNEEAYLKHKYRKVPN